MSKRKEKISAFLDNDMHSDELMSFSLSAEASDAKVAQRYQMMGDALRGEMSDASFTDVSHAVRETLRDEKLSVVSQATNFQAANSQVESSPAQVSSKAGFFDLSSWFKPVAGMAVAASVAVIMVVSVNEQGGAESNIVANADSQISSPLEVQSAQLLDEDKATNLDPYINQHLEFASQDTLQGRLPYVRAVSFTPRNK
ncbi:hypothetical protein MNBD_GAMMA06-910 [hydrothermal vent metagenome]|uniref:Anti sigma-E protein RseA N-terminal domain-containing protein n=1 Tax=hydrothermal vent metagenome TaxID=652676 RepID=A0A3B0WGI0_9ZZZZ